MIQVSFETHHKKEDLIVNKVLLEYKMKENGKSIADMCSYNHSYFSRIFKNHTGMTFTGYLKKARLNKAEGLLLNTDMSITDIIFESGYTDKTKFFSDFKKLKGETPFQYRKSKK